MTHQVSRTFRKEEKLCSKKLLGDLFLSGENFLSYPVKVVWKSEDSLPGDSPVQVVFSVPKRVFKHAVDRNRLKRLLREAYRLQKAPLYEALNQARSRMTLALIYIAKEELPYARIAPAVGKALDRLGKPEQTGRPA